MRGKIFALICALALAEAEVVRLNSNGCPIDITVDSGFYPNCNRNIKHYNAVDYSDPKQAPMICAAPGSNSILIAHEHCNQFYQCWNGKPIAMSCYGDLQYNPSLEICDWPASVECGARIVPECDEDGEETPSICAPEDSKDALLPHNECNKFYKCEGGHLITYTCPGTLLYNPTAGYCDCACSVECEDRIVPDNSGNGSDNGDTGNGANGDTGNGAGNCDPSEAGNICSKEGSNGVLVANERCNKFYKCDNGVPVPQSCPAGLLFNPAKDVCDWPDNVDCGDRIITGNESEEDNSGNGDSGNGDSGNGDSGNGGSDNGGSGNGDSGNGGNGAGNCDPSEAGNICSKEGSNGVLVANERCNKFYECDNGVPVPQSCPAGLLFNPAKDVCDWPDNVDCGDRIIIGNESEEDNSGNGDSGNGGSGNGDSGNGGSGNGDSGNGSNGAGNCDPSEAANICSKEGSNGVLVANERCNKFYKCDNGVPVPQSCPAGLLFNPAKDVCDWPDNVDCGDRIIIGNESEEDNSGNGDSGNGGSGNGDSGNGGSDNGGSGNGDSGNGGNGAGNCDPSEAGNICSKEGSNGVLVANERCNKFYKCDNGVPVPQSCPTGLLFNPAKDVCDWPDNVDCGDRIITDNESEEDNSGNGDSGSGGSGNGDSDNGGSGNGDSGNGGSGTCNCNPGEAASICSNLKAEGVFVANENCNQFYVCVGGKNVVMTCPSGLLYNPYSEKCDWPDNVDCGDRIAPGDGGSDSGDNGDSGNGDSGNGDSGNGGSDNGGNGAGNCDPSEAENICAKKGSDGVLVANEQCNKFYKCDNGVPTPQRCPAGLLFNPAKDVCDWPDNVDCGDRIIIDNESEEDNNGDNGNGDSGNGDSGNGGSGNGDSGNSGSDNGGNGAGNCDPSEAGNICANKGSDGVLIANEQCNKFYKCDNGVPTPQRCPSGLLFNPAKDVCDWPDNVDCGDRIITDNESEEDNNGDNGNGDSGNGDSGNGGSGNGDSGNGDSGNGGSGTCNCNPGEAASICSNLKAEGVFVANKNCNQFYVCVGGKNVVMTCPSGLLYNPYSEKCDWPDNVDCGDRIAPGDGGSDSGDNGDSGNGDSDNGDSGNGGSDNGGNGAGNCDPSEAGNICAKKGSDGVLVANEQCNKFYKCDNGVPTPQRCPAGLLFNPAKDVCDWPDNVDCGDRIIIDNESEEDNNGDNGNGDSGNGDSGNGGSGNGDSGNSGSDNGGNGAGNCDPSEAGNICANKGSDGVLIANEQCNKFYKCDNGVPTPQRCPSGLLFNPAKDVCDWPDNVDCGDRIITDNESEEDNNGDNGNGDSGNGDSGNGGSGNGDSGIGDSGNGGSGTCNCNPGEAASICSNLKAEGVFVANENCNQFYVCVGGKNVVMTCPSGLLYNPYSEQCDWPDNVDCGDRIAPGDGGSDNGDNGDSGNGDSGNGDSGNGGSDNGGNGAGNCDPSEAGNICAKKGSDGVLVANEQCNKFYKCDNGVPTPQRCPAGLLFNPAKDVCDWPDKVDCGDRIIIDNESEEDHNGDNDNGDSGNGDSENGGSGNGDSGNGGSDNGGNGAGNCDPSEAGNICANKGSDGVLIANEQCNKFYKCDNGVPTPQRCPAGLLFNPAKDVCDWPDNVDCGDRIITDNESEEDNNGDNGNGDSGNGDSGNGGSGNGDSGNGDSGNGGSGTCNCNPGEAASICSNLKAEGVFVANENCNQFYVCVGGKNVVMTCPSGLLYNPYSEQCDWPKNVICGDRIAPGDGGSDNGDNGDSGNGNSGNGGSGNGGSGNGDSGNGDSGDGGSGTCNCNPGEAASICSNLKAEGVFVANENCNQFYVCVGGKNVVMTCPSGLLYNPYSEQCDWPNNVDCGDRIAPGDGGSDNGDNGDSGNGDSDNGDSGNGGSDNGGNGAGNCDPSEAGNICAKKGSDGVLVANEQCNKFYKCDNGVPTPQRCPAGLLFNPAKDVCDWPDTVDCGDRIIIDNESEEDNKDDNGNGESGNGDSGNGDSGDGDSGNGDSGTCNCNPNEASAICSGPGSEGTLVAHENCHQFYICLGGTNVTLDCPSGLLYNPNKIICDWPESVDCGERVVPGAMTEVEEEEKELSSYDYAVAMCALEGSAGKTYPHEDCNRYYLCTNSQPVVYRCGTTLLYDLSRQRCFWQENVNCGDRTTTHATSFNKHLEGRQRLRNL